MHWFTRERSSDFLERSLELLNIGMFARGPCVNLFEFIVVHVDESHHLSHLSTELRGQVLSKNNKVHFIVLQCGEVLDFHLTCTEGPYGGFVLHLEIHNPGVNRSVSQIALRRDTHCRTTVNLQFYGLLVKFHFTVNKVVVRLD